MGVNAPKFVGLSAYGDKGSEEWYVDLMEEEVVKLIPRLNADGWEMKFDDDYKDMARRLSDDDRRRYVLFIPGENVFVGSGYKFEPNWIRAVHDAMRILGIPLDEATLKTEHGEFDFGRVQFLTWVRRNSHKCPASSLTPSTGVEQGGH